MKLRYVASSIVFTALLLPISGIRIRELAAKCATLDTLASVKARMYKHSCFVLLDEGEDKPSSNFYEQLARCQNITGMTNGHLPWVRSQMCIHAQIADRATLDGLKALFSNGPFNRWPPMGVYRFGNASLSDGDGWYLIGSSLGEAHGPLPFMLGNTTGMRRPVIGKSSIPRHD